jgi:hypothetical protein
MRFDAARVGREKIVDYLLGSSSVAAVAKVRFFGGMGFTVDRWLQLADALRNQAAASEVEVEATGWGTKDIAAGPIDAPDGRRYKVARSGSTTVPAGGGSPRIRRRSRSCSQNTHQSYS